MINFLIGVIAMGVGVLIGMGKNHRGAKPGG